MTSKKETTEVKTPVAGTQPAEATGEGLVVSSESITPMVESLTSKLGKGRTVEAPKKVTVSIKELRLIGSSLKDMTSDFEAEVLETGKGTVKISYFNETRGVMNTATISNKAVK